MHILDTKKRLLEIKQARKFWNQQTTLDLSTVNTELQYFGQETFCTGIREQTEWNIFVIKLQYLTGFLKKTTWAEIKWSNDATER